MLTEIRLEDCELDCAMIGKRVRDARKAKKVTQEELSEHCGCTPQAECLLCLLRHRRGRYLLHLALIVYRVDYQGI